MTLMTASILGCPRVAPGSSPSMVGMLTSLHEEVNCADRNTTALGCEQPTYNVVGGLRNQLVHANVTDYTAAD